MVPPLRQGIRNYFRTEEILMKFYCAACCKPWYNLDVEDSSTPTPNRSCPKCMREAGYRWVNVMAMTYTEIKEAA